MHHISQVLAFFALLLSLARHVTCELELFSEDDEDKIPEIDERLKLPQIFVFAALVLLTIPMRRVVIRSTITINERLFWLLFAGIYSIILCFNIRRRWFDVTWKLAPKQLLAVYMPISLFKTAYMIDLHMLKRAIVQVLIVGVVCVMIKGSLLSTILKYIIRDDNAPWTVPLCFLCGSACTPGELSTYLHVLNDFEKYKHLVTILEGEELFSSVTVLCMFEVALGFHEQYLVTWYQPTMIILRLIVLGLLVGVTMGLIISWVMRVVNDALNVVMVTIMGTFMAWYISEYTFAFSGCIACTVVGFFMAKEKASMSIEVDVYVNIFWNVFSDMCTTVFFISLLGMILERLMYTSKLYMYPAVFCTYALSGMTRLLSLLSMAPILSRTGYGMDFRSMLLLVWSNTKGPLPLIIGLMVFHYKNMNIWGTHILAHISGVCILCLALNGSTLQVLLKMFGFMELSNVRKTNMNNCMKYLQEKRDGMIAILKMNRFLSDANWPVVISSTIVQHPYKLKITTDDEDTLLWGARESICPTCKKTINIVPTSKEIKDMTMEARMRVLKTQRISYIRQYESGMLSKVGIRSLLQAVEIAIDSTEPIIKLDDYFKVIKTKPAHEWIKKLLIKGLRRLKSEVKPPQKVYLRMCYNCITSPTYSVVFVLIVLANVIFTTVACLISLKHNMYRAFPLTSLYYFGFLITFYTMDMLVRILAYSYDSYWTGLKQYFRCVFNIIDCIVIMLFVAMLACHIYNLQNYEQVLTYVILLRICRLFNVNNDLIPKMIRGCESSIDKRIMFAYDVGKALVTGYEESIDILSQVVENKVVRDSIKKQIEDDRLKVTKELGMIQKDSPWIAISIKTKQATRATLNHLRSAVTDLKMSGFVDDFEYDKLSNSIEESLKQERMLRVVTISSPKRLFKEVQWTGYHSDVSDFLYENTSSQIWDTGDIIVKCGKKAEAVYILVTGLFRISYVPDKNVLHNVYHKGALPIMDYIPSSKFEESLEEFIFSGNSMGELCVLTDRRYNSTVIAEAPSQAFILPHKIMREAMERDRNPINGLEARIWKYVSVTLACEILQETPQYQSITQEEVRLTLVRSFIPNLRCYKVFVINELIEDVVLIEGVVMDLNSRAFFTAPCYIPRTVHKIVLPTSSFYTRETIDSVLVKLLIIPGKDADEIDIMNRAEDISDLVSNPSNSCLVPKSYGKKMKRRKRFNKKAKDEEKKKQDDDILTMPEADEDWVSGRIDTIEVIDVESPAVVPTKDASLKSASDSNKSSDGGDESTEPTKDVIRLRKKKKRST